MSVLLRAVPTLCVWVGILVLGLPASWSTASASLTTARAPVSSPFPGTSTWKAGWKYYTPVIFFDKAETHRLGTAPPALAALRGALPSPFRLILRLEAIALAVNAAQAEARGLCVFVGPHGGSNWYRGGYCR